MRAIIFIVFLVLGATLATFFEEQEDGSLFLRAEPVDEQSSNQTQTLGTLSPTNGTTQAPADVHENIQHDSDCPPLLGKAQAEFHSGKGCEWTIITDKNGCQRFFQNCGPKPPSCHRQNEIWYQCKSNCEPTCDHPNSFCSKKCKKGGCQCFPGFVRDGKHCVPQDQCEDELEEKCKKNKDCSPGKVCQKRKCQWKKCKSDHQCPGDLICIKGKCAEDEG